MYCLGRKFNTYGNPGLLFFLEASEEPLYLLPIPPFMLTSGHGVEQGYNKIFSPHSRLLPSATPVPPAEAKPGAEKNVSS